jgi:hypothetical protein
VVTKDEAFLLVYRLINQPDPYWPNRPEMVIVEQATIERPWGWVFFFDSAAHLESGDIRDALGGNGPCFVTRDDGAITQVGTAHPVEHYLQDFEQKLSRRGPGAQ